MKKQIIRVSAIQSAKVAAVLYLVTSLPFLVLMAFSPMFGKGGLSGFSTGVMIAIPIGYALAGFLFTCIAAGVYNLVAKMVGGFEFTTAEVGAK
jgi:uncharacterized membrane protein (DUF485 family)